ncbi:SRPBCC domain-containing protein [Dactylosporangium sp. AC04546]|uniref:SRPBCC domain-containing protein n=1 Tax=Dactylosporangium sp. AC04546 TaxID=2862460 RepID=UPI001EDFF229|nr:SRPBCC domain-containing protein [Dactylosporangium sp. AC04546]WVK85394.1 SRPBCC domain-containing protein [Dactylosporangium sp. AC04546]
MRTRTFSLYIAATAEQVWRALTDPCLTRRFYLGCAVESTFTAGDTIVYRTTIGPVTDALHGEIIHVEPHKLLVHSLFTGIGREQEVHCWLAWEVAEVEPGLTRAALTCDDLDRNPDPERDETWSRVVSGLKTVLETGAEMKR